MRLETYYQDSVFKLLSIWSDSMVLASLLLNRVLIFSKRQALTVGGNTKLADVVKGLGSHCNIIDLDEECLCEGGSFETLQEEIGLKKCIFKAFVNVLFMLEFPFIIIIIIFIIIIFIINIFVVAINLVCGI